MESLEAWNTYFAPMHCLNFSIRDDKIENLLWRVENGELELVKPKIIVLYVGSNNVENKSEEIAEGIFETVKRIRCKLPDTYIILPVSLGVIIYCYHFLKNLFADSTTSWAASQQIAGKKQRS